MNQQQGITNFKAKGYTVAFCTNQFSVMTRPVGNEHTGQVVFKDGTIKTMQSTDAVRAINNEEINMSKYYTKKMINELTEKERTALYNERTGKSVARIQKNNTGAVEAILAANPKLVLEDSEKHRNAVAMEEQVAVDAVKVSAKDNGKHDDEPKDFVDLGTKKSPVQKRPKEGTVCDTVWVIASTQKNKTRAEVIEFCVSQGINKATASTQYQRWKKYNENN